MNGLPPWLDVSPRQFLEAASAGAANERANLQLFEHARQFALEHALNQQRLAEDIRLAEERLAAQERMHQAEMEAQAAERALKWDIAMRQVAAEMAKAQQEAMQREQLAAMQLFENIRKTNVERDIAKARILADLEKAKMEAGEKEVERTEKRKIIEQYQAELAKADTPAKQQAVINKYLPYFGWKPELSPQPLAPAAERLEITPLPNGEGWIVSDKYTGKFTVEKTDDNAALLKQLGEASKLIDSFLERNKLSLFNYDEWPEDQKAQYKTLQDQYNAILGRLQGGRVTRTFRLTPNGGFAEVGTK